MRERVQVQDTQGRAALQVVARPGAVAVAPQRAAGTSSGMQLAEALSSIRPEINRHLNDYQQEFEQKEAERAYDTLQGMTFQEAKAMVDAGKIRETENPWFEAAFMKQFGLSYAGKRKRDIMLAYETQFDKNNGDIEQFIKEHIQADANAYGDNRFVASGIREGMGDFVERLRDQHAEFRATNIRNTAVDQFYGAAMTVADDAIANGGDPSAAVRALYGQHRAALGLTFAEMDANVMQLAARYAQEGNLEAVRSLLQTDIVGEDGQPVGAFVNRPKYADEAQRLLNTAEAKRADRDRELATTGVVSLRIAAQNGLLSDADKQQLNALKESGQISQEFHESLLMQDSNARSGALVASSNAVVESSFKDHVTSQLVSGKAFGVEDYTYVDASGKTVTLKRDEYLETAVNDTLKGMAAAGHTETQMAGTLASWGVDTTYAPWENAMTDGYLALGQALSSRDKDGNVDLPPAAIAGYGTWKALSEYPNLRARHIKDNTALRVYQDAEALERAGIDANTALLTSSTLDRNAARNGLTTQISREQLSSAVRKEMENGWGADAENGGFVSAKIEELSRILIDGGAPPTRAVKEASRMFRESHTVINGVAVNHRNKLVPPDFGPMATGIVEQFASSRGEDPSELTLIPSLDGEQHWVIAYKSTLLPHEEWQNGGKFSITDIQRQAEAARMIQRSLERDKLNQRLEEEQRDRIDPPRGGEVRKRNRNR